MNIDLSCNVILWTVRAVPQGLMLCYTVLMSLRTPLPITSFLGVTDHSLLGASMYFPYPYTMVSFRMIIFACLHDIPSSF